MVCDPFKCPWSQCQTKGKLLKNKHRAIQNEGWLAVEQPTDGDMGDVLQIQSATPHGFHSVHGNRLNEHNLEMRNNQVFEQA